MADIIGVSITQESVQVVPGESATIGVTVKNASNVVDVLYISVEGLDPSWYQLSVVQSSLFPGDEATGTEEIVVLMALASQILIVVGVAEVEEHQLHLVRPFGYDVADGQRMHHAWLGRVHWPR